jgi:parallel beta-helix repeat protein
MITSNKVTSNHDVGLRLTSSQVTLTGNTITSNGGAINATGGSLSISSNNVTSNKQGLRLVDAIGTVSGNTIGGQTGYGIYILGGSINGTATNTFNPNNGEGRVAWAWDLLIKTSRDTKDGLVLAPNSEVQVYDANGEIVFSGVTNDSGQTKLIEVVQRNLDNTGTEVVLTPHTLKASLNSTRATQKVNMSQNQTVMLVLGKKAATGLPIPQLLLATGVILICIAVGLALNWKFKGTEEGPEPRIKREASRRRRGRKRSLTSTSTSRNIRARRHKRRD